MFTLENMKGGFEARPCPFARFRDRLFTAWMQLPGSLPSIAASKERSCVACQFDTMSGSCQLRRFFGSFSEARRFFGFIPTTNYHSSLLDCKKIRSRRTERFFGSFSLFVANPIFRFGTAGSMENVFHGMDC